MDGTYCRNPYRLRNPLLSSEIVMGYYPLGFASLLLGGILGIAGITGSSIHSIVQGRPDHSKVSPVTVSESSQPTTSSKGWKSELQNIAKHRNWNASDWEWIVEHESSGNPNSVNSSSGAFGLGQFLPEHKREYPEAFSHNPNLQIRAMSRYIANRYGTPTKARQFHEVHGWY